MAVIVVRSIGFFFSSLYLTNLRRLLIAAIIMAVDGTTYNKVTVVLGAQWGDEGKGKVVDMLASDADLVCRCQVR